MIYDVADKRVKFSLTIIHGNTYIVMKMFPKSPLKSHYAVDQALTKLFQLNVKHRCKNINDGTRHLVLLFWHGAHTHAGWPLKAHSL